MPVRRSDAPVTWNANRTSVPGFLGKEIVPHPAGWGAFPPRSAIFHPGRVAQLAEARRRERRECWFKSSRDHHFPMDPKLRQRSIRLLTGRAGRTSLRVHHHFCGSKTTQPNPPERHMTARATPSRRNPASGRHERDQISVSFSRSCPVPFVEGDGPILFEMKTNTAARLPVPFPNNLTFLYFEDERPDLSGRAGGRAHATCA